VIARELHQDGVPHVHAFIKYEKKVQFSATRWDLDDYHGHYLPAKSWTAVQQYCKKGGNFISSIDVESALQKRGKQNLRLLTEPIQDLVESGQIRLLDLKKLVEARATFKMLKLPENQTQCRGIWYYGPPGAGKSHAVRTAEPSLYLKAQNKWWCGYQGEPAVLLDDFDKHGACLSHYLKIWADKWACTGEIKGCTIPLNYQRFYITSNYQPHELFGDQDPDLLDAITRRFKIVYINNLNSVLRRL
jgi:hypothetical protein